MCISIGRMEGMHIKRPKGQGKGVLAPLFSKGGVYFYTFKRKVLCSEPSAIPDG